MREHQCKHGHHQKPRKKRRKSQKAYLVQATEYTPRLASPVQKQANLHLLHALIVHDTSSARLRIAKRELC